MCDRQEERRKKPDTFVLSVYVDDMGAGRQGCPASGSREHTRDDLVSCWTRDTGSQEEVCAVIKLYFVGAREDGWAERQWLFWAMIKHDRIMRHGGLLGLRF